MIDALEKTKPEDRYIGKMYVQNVPHWDVPTPCGKSGEYEIDETTVTVEAADRTNMSCMMMGSAFMCVKPGTYKRLIRGNRTIVMSNTPMEVSTNIGFVRMATGRVLVNGLGLGMVLHQLLQKPDVTHVDVVEISEDVIKLTGPTFDDPRVTIIHADALTWRPAKGVRYDAVWHDIWDTISEENNPDMVKLHRAYGSRAGWQGSWARGLWR